MNNLDSKYSRTKKGLIHGVGINDSDYNISKTAIINGVQKVIWRCPFYVTWKHMIQRCYSEKYKQENLTYKNATSCDDWIYLSRFKAWMETQDWIGKQLDKDILFPGNKIYSPETCVFVDCKVNNFVIERNAKRGDLPIGVVQKVGSKKFMAQCQVMGRSKHLGYFNTPEEAHAAWLAFKLEQAYTIAEEQTDQRVAQALINRYKNYENNTNSHLHP